MLDREPYPTIPKLEIGVEGVQKLLAGLNVNKASGPDEIPCRILRELAIELAPIFTCLFQQSIDRGELPSDWLKPNVTPIYKKGDRH